MEEIDADVGLLLLLFLHWRPSNEWPPVLITLCILTASIITATGLSIAGTAQRSVGLITTTAAAIVIALSKTSATIAAHARSVVATTGPHIIATHIIHIVATNGLTRRHIIAHTWFLLFNVQFLAIGRVLWEVQGLQVELWIRIIS